MKRSLSREQLNPKQFRRWLVHRVSETAWANRNTRDMTLDQLSEMLGVRTDVLVDSRRLILSRDAEATKVAGLEPIRNISDGKRVASGNFAVKVELPIEIKKAWEEYRSLGGYTDSVLLRSIVHYGLLRREQPSWLGRGWPYQGKVYTCDGIYEFEKVGKTWPYQLVTWVSMSARMALVRRTRATRVTIRAFVRGLILDLLNGKIQSFTTVPEISQMFATERYQLLEGELEKSALEQQKGTKKT